ncbi:MAG: hypothetical protein K0R29_1117 [Pseudobdellovibrio sp.]|jgi:uncharacterized protein (DUF2147 family)|nr:hypothetical protein [Pseudobdellovibrio sp.]
MKLFLMTFIFGSVVFAQSAIVGQWKTIDDETGKPKSIIEIFEKDGVYNGRIVRLFREPTEDQNPKCDKCSGDKKDQPVLGMQNLVGLKKDSDTQWSGGEILDPKNGKTYSCKAEVIDGGKKLKLRGFIGFSLIGRTQTWERVEAEAATGAQSVKADATNAPAAEASQPASGDTSAKPETVKATPSAKKPADKKKK